uniref:Uncharacterized protein n=1 Tax=Rhizophora mucronata TaxID=61149 RepID=A0A2P2PWY9_RHIMU
MKCWRRVRRNSIACCVKGVLFNVLDLLSLLMSISCYIQLRPLIDSLW